MRTGSNAETSYSGMGRFSATAAVLASAFVAVTTLVAVGAFARLDQYAVSHMMPGLGPDRQTPSLLTSLVPLLRDASYHATAIDEAGNFLALPASPLVSFLLTAMGGFALWRRERACAAFAWGLAWIAANGIEVVLKSLLPRPPLYTRVAGSTVQVTAFDGSFPSGHAARALLLALLAASLWPRCQLLLFAWVATVVVAIEVGGWHTPSDLVGGLLLASLLATIVLGQRGLMWRRGVASGHFRRWIDRRALQASPHERE